jgi:hypothetical protein
MTMPAELLPAPTPAPAGASALDREALALWQTGLTTYITRLENRVDQLQTALERSVADHSRAHVALHERVKVREMALDRDEAHRQNLIGATAQRASELAPETRRNRPLIPPVKKPLPIPVTREEIEARIKLLENVSLPTVEKTIKRPRDKAELNMAEELREKVIHAIAHWKGKLAALDDAEKAASDASKPDPGPKPEPKPTPEPPPAKRTARGWL